MAKGNDIKNAARRGNRMRVKDQFFNAGSPQKTEPITPADPVAPAEETRDLIEAEVVVQAPEDSVTPPVEQREVTEGELVTTPLVEDPPMEPVNEELSSSSKAEPLVETEPVVKEIGQQIEEVVKPPVDQPAEPVNGGELVDPPAPQVEELLGDPVEEPNPNPKDQGGSELEDPPAKQEDETPEPPKTPVKQKKDPKPTREQKKKQQEEEPVSTPKKQDDINQTVSVGINYGLSAKMKMALLQEEEVKEAKYWDLHDKLSLTVLKFVTEGLDEWHEFFKRRGVPMSKKEMVEDGMRMLFDLFNETYKNKK